MLDFAKVTGIQIPEGSAKLLTIGGQTAWSAEKWDLSWVFNGSLPDTEKWGHTAGADTVYIDSEKGAMVIASDDYDVTTEVFARLQEGTLFSEPAALEVEFMYGSAATAGRTEIVLGAGYDRCLLCRIAESTSGDAYLTVYHTNESGSTVQTSYSLTRDVWHTLRLDLSEDAHSFVTLDDVILKEFSADQLATSGYEGAYLSALKASVFVRALRYKGFVPSGS